MRVFHQRRYGIRIEWSRFGAKMYNECTMIENDIGYHMLIMNLKKTDRVEDFRGF